MMSLTDRATPQVQRGSVRAEPSRRVASDYPLPFEIVSGATGPVQLAKHGEFSLLPN